MFCGRPQVAESSAGWGEFGARPRCPTCLIDAVETQETARRFLPVIRGELADIGIELETRVLVRLVAHDQLTSEPGMVDSVVLGVTEKRGSRGRQPDVVEIRIAAGLPPAYFGRAVTHEVGHAWLAQTGCPTPAPVVEEGLCELFSYAWFKRQRSPLASGLRRQLRDNPDPIYGGGFRTVHAAVVRAGIKAVLSSLAQTGTLP